MSSVRRALKTFAERAVLHLGGGTVGRWRLAGRALVVAYHNVVPDDAPRIGDWPVHLPVSQFLQQVDLLQEIFDIVPLSEVHHVRENSRPVAALTFDDAYLGAVTLAWDALRARGLPATCFVTPGLLGGHTFWWDALSPAADGLDEETRRHVLAKLQGRDEAARAWARATGRPLRVMPAIGRSADEASLRRAADSGMTLGAHSWDHPSLPTLDFAALEEQLHSPLAWLRERFSREAIPWIAYPYGLTSPAVAAATARAGYVGAVVADGGAFAPPDVPPHLVPRLTVPASISADSFHLWTLGLRLRQRSGAS